VFATVVLRTVPKCSHDLIPPKKRVRLNIGSTVGEQGQPLLSDSVQPVASRNQGLLEREQHILFEEALSCPLVPSRHRQHSHRSRSGPPQLSVDVSAATWAIYFCTPWPSGCARSKDELASSPARFRRSARSCSRGRRLARVCPGGDTFFLFGDA